MSSQVEQFFAERIALSKLKTVLTCLQFLDETLVCVGLVIALNNSFQALLTQIALMKGQKSKIQLDSVM